MFACCERLLISACIEVELMKTNAILLAIVVTALAIACTSNSGNDLADTPPSVDLTNFDALNEWYSSDIIASNIGQAYRNIGQQSPSVGHFAQACVLSRKAGFVKDISRDELANRTRGDGYYTAYNVGIAWMLAGGTPDEQKEWCGRVVALYNFEPWFGKKIEW